MSESTHYAPRTYRYAHKVASTVRSTARSTRSMARLVYGPVLKAPKRVAFGFRNVGLGLRKGWQEAS